MLVQVSWKKGNLALHCPCALLVQKRLRETKRDYAYFELYDHWRKNQNSSQEYVADPFLMADQLKFDFRVYGVIKSLNPLSIYVAREGLEEWRRCKNINEIQEWLDSALRNTLLQRHPISKICTLIWQITRWIRDTGLMSIRQICKIKSRVIFFMLVASEASSFSLTQ